MIERKYTGIAKQGADVVANPTLDGSEEALNSIQINGENFIIEGGKKVLTIDDINPEVINEHPDLTITLNDRNYNNTHIVIDWLEVVNKYIDDTYTYFDNVNVYLSEQTKNCTIEIVNIPGEENKGMSINGGKTICLIPIMYQSVVIDYVGLNFYASYSDNNIDDYTNCIGVCQSDEYNYSIISMIADVDVFGNVVVRVIHNFEY